MKRLLFVFLLALAVSVSAQELPVGAKIQDFQLVDLAGKPVKVAAANGITVVIFVSTNCPISNDYNERMNAIYKEYSPKGVNFVFVNSNHNESAEDVRQHLAANKLGYPVLKDADNRVADTFNAQFTPESYVIDKTGVLRYHGSIDDSRNVTKVSEQRLRKAIDAVVAGKAPDPAETKAFGCTIKRVKKAS